MGQDWQDMLPRNDTNKALDREFAVLCFSWNGTVVADREVDPLAVRSRVERLCALGVDIAIVSGANVATIDGQLHARPDVEGRLFLFLSSGSEVYVVGPNGPRLLERRRATQVEEAQLSAAAEALRDRLADAGLDIEVLNERLNRRTIDLGPEWPHPSGARIARAGIEGVGGIFDLARSVAGEAGLAHPRISGVAGHVEIGLTDKSDSMRHVLRELILDRGRRPQDLIVLGDDYGASGGVEGSDYLTLIPELRRSTFVSVGAEPNGVPPRVLHVGGGPDEFLRILHDQLAFRESVAQASFPTPVRDPGWRFEVKGFDPFREREVETWLTVANGESGTRGALEEGSAVSTVPTSRAFGSRSRRRTGPAFACAPGAASSICRTVNCLSTSACSTCATASSTGIGASSCAVGTRCACARRVSRLWPTARSWRSAPRLRPKTLRGASCGQARSA
jgi:hypothetical protein